MLLSDTMSQSPGPASQKRKRSEPSSLTQSLTEHERLVYDVIRSTQNMGIWVKHLKEEVKLPDSLVTKILKSLKDTKWLIKEVPNIKDKKKKHYMATEFEPSAEISGGVWYTDGNLDLEVISQLKRTCVNIINRESITTVEGITDLINRSGCFSDKYSKQNIEEILRVLVIDNEIMEVTSNGKGELASFPVGKVCYKCISKGRRRGGEPILSAMASIPCGVCPRISICSPGGVINPTTCAYYTKWLDF